MYRQLPYKLRSNTEKFLDCLKTKCLSREYLKKERVRINSKRARDYMAAYFIEMISQGNADGNNKVSLKDLKATAVKANKIEKMKRTFKTHRCAFDFDKGFVKIKVTREEEAEDEEKDKKNEVKKR